MFVYACVCVSQMSDKIRIDNLFYEAEDNKRRDPERALKMFEECVEIECKGGGNIDKYVHTPIQHTHTSTHFLHACM